MRLRVLPDGESWVLGKLPEGCRRCARGAKLVLFITGLCDNPPECSWYCPISLSRRGKDEMYANERLIKDVADVLEEARLIDAEGTGVTGGEPLMVLNRTLEFIRVLKDNFGSRHHIHLYTSGRMLSEKAIKRLVDAGLDELRIHLPRVEAIRKALEYPISVGVEVPVLPSSEGRLRRMAVMLDELGVEFLNLNELEFSEGNADKLKEKGFSLREGSFVAAAGSRETAERLLDWAREELSMSIHYCSARFKDSIQLRNRLARRARNVARPYEAVTDDGLLVKGVIHGVPASKLDSLAASLKEKFRIPSRMIRVNREKCRIETSVRMAYKIAKRIPKAKRGFKIGVVEEYPTEEPRLETEYTPL